MCPHPASFRHHERLEALPEVGFGHAQHSGITNVVASDQQVLDLTGEHVLPASDHHLVGAAIDDVAQPCAEQAWFTAMLRPYHRRVIGR